MTGFGNEFATEDSRCPNSLPVGQNSPQVCPYGLYAEQLSGSAFTGNNYFSINLRSYSLIGRFIAPRDANRRTWFYRIRPAVLHRPFQRVSTQLSADFSAHPPNPNQVSPFTKVKLLLFCINFFSNFADEMETFRHSVRRESGFCRRAANSLRRRPTCDS